MFINIKIKKNIQKCHVTFPFCKNVNVLFFIDYIHKSISINEMVVPSTRQGG